MLLSVLRWPDPRLSQVSAPAVLSDDLARLVSDMLETMYQAGGRGLAAPQVGVLSRVFVMDLTWKSSVPAPQVFINPKILAQSPSRKIGPEGCLSIPGPTTLIERAEELHLAWTALDGSSHQAWLTGMAAICAQHEYDHLDGILTLDRLSPEDRAIALTEVLK